MRLGFPISKQPGRNNPNRDTLRYLIDFLVIVIVISFLLVALM